MSQIAMLVARKPSCHDSKCIFDQIKGNLTKIEPKNHQNVQETPFSQKAPGFNGLILHAPRADQIGLMYTPRCTTADSINLFM